MLCPNRVVSILFACVVFSVPFSRVARCGIPTEDIVTSGFNVDIITDADVATRHVTDAFDYSKCTFFEKGILQDGKPREDGLPAGSVFTSATGSGAHYTFRRASDLNALRLGFGTSIAGSTSSGNSRTLQIKPGRYASIAILASSGNATKTATATGSITYSEGPPSLFSYKAYDWDYSGIDRPAALAIGPLARNLDAGSDGARFLIDMTHKRFGLWETILTPGEGLDPNRTVVSISFDRTKESSGAGVEPATSVFAVSGEPIPEAAMLLLVLPFVSGMGIATLRRRRLAHSRANHDSI